VIFSRQDRVEDAEELHPNIRQKVRGKDEMCEVEDVTLHTAFVGRLLTSQTVGTLPETT
jgi:hypothetical protein